MNKLTQDEQVYLRYYKEWNKFIRDILKVRLDRRQRKAVDIIQTHDYVILKSGHACGKDYLSAVISVTFLICNAPSQVINTAPSGRQVNYIMLAEEHGIITHSGLMNYPGIHMLNDGIKMYDKKQLQKKATKSKWFLVGFKAPDKETEAWTGFHSPNTLVCVTEGSGIRDETYHAIEGLSTSQNFKMLVVLNPHKAVGYTYNAMMDENWENITWSCLDSVNVRAKKELIPGQVSYQYIERMVKNWSHPIKAKEAKKTKKDFKFEGKWYRPTDTFRIKVLGEYAEEPEDQLIPTSWIYASFDRWKKLQEEITDENIGNLIWGEDIAGEGHDKTCLIPRSLRWNYIPRIITIHETDSMKIVGQTSEIIKNKNQRINIDSIGEGAGAYSRLKEKGYNITSAKFSMSAKGLTCFHNINKFHTMRDYCFWAIRDNLNPDTDGELALPENMQLLKQLTSIHFYRRSDDKIKIEDKEEIKKKAEYFDEADALALTYFKIRERNEDWSQCTIDVPAR